MAQALTAHSYQFDYQLPTGRWRWTTLFDISGAVAVTQVTDILSPFGRLRDSIPLPGEVVTAMAESIATVRAQFPPEILVGPPSSLTFTVDEARGWSDPQTCMVTNTGSYGSLLTASLATTADYVSVTPSVMGALGFNATGLFEASVDSADLLAASSPYTAQITVQDPNAVGSPVSIPVTVVVRPRATISVTPATLNFSVERPLTGDWPAVPSQTFVVENTGPAGSVLEWQVLRLGNTSTWLDGVGPSSGTLTSGQTATITVHVAPDSATFGSTSYTETLRVSGYSTNEYQDVTVNLQVT